MATTIHAAVVCDNSTLARFQSWVSMLWNAFTTLGWIQTGDGGQSANPPAALPVSQYFYQIFRANDTQAGTLPIYVKVEVGYTSASVQIWMTVGTGSDGSGNITGPTIGRYQINGNAANQGATTFDCYFSGDAGEFRAMLWQTSINTMTIFGIERSKDTSGAKTTDYVTALAANGYVASNWFQQSFMNGFGNPTPKEGALMTFCSTSQAPQTEYFNGNTAANPIVPLIGYPGNQMLGFCSAAAADVAESNGTTVTVNIYGSNHPFLATKNFNAAPGGRLSPGGASQGALLMRYE